MERKNKLDKKKKNELNTKNIHTLYNDKLLTLFVDLTENCLVIRRKKSGEINIIDFIGFRLVYAASAEVLVIVYGDNQREFLDVHSEKERDRLVEACRGCIYRAQNLENNEMAIRFYWGLLQGLECTEDKCACLDMLDLYEEISEVLLEDELSEYMLYKGFYACYRAEILLPTLTRVVKQKSVLQEDLENFYDVIYSELEKAINVNIYEAYTNFINLFLRMNDCIQSQDINGMKSKLVFDFNRVCDQLFKAICGTGIVDSYGQHFNAISAKKWNDREKFTISHRIGTIYEINRIATDVQKANIWYDLALASECAADTLEYAEIAYFKANKVCGVNLEEREEWLVRAANKGHECAAYELAELLEEKGDGGNANYWRKMAICKGAIDDESMKKLQIERHGIIAQNWEKELKNWDGVLDAASQSAGMIVDNALVKIVSKHVGEGFKLVFSSAMKWNKERKKNKAEQDKNKQERSTDVYEEEDC